MNITIQEFSPLYKIITKVWSSMFYFPVFEQEWVLEGTPKQGKKRCQWARLAVLSCTNSITVAIKIFSLTMVVLNGHVIFNLRYNQTNQQTENHLCLVIVFLLKENFFLATGITFLSQELYFLATVFQTNLLLDYAISLIFGT